MSEEIDKLLAINVPPSGVEGRSENHEGHIQKHTTGWAFLGWVSVIAGAWFLFQGFAAYADGTNPEITASTKSMEEVVEAAARARERMGLPRFDSAPPSDLMDEAGKHGLIGGALFVVGLGLAFGTSVFRCSECGGKVAMETAKICPSCGTTFVARK